MMKYIISGHMTVSCWTEVEADTKKEALLEAENREAGGLCHNAIYPGHDECWHFDIDGEPTHIRIDSED